MPQFIKHQTKRGETVFPRYYIVDTITNQRTGYLRGSIVDEVLAQLEDEVRKLEGITTHSCHTWVDHCSDQPGMIETVHGTTSKFEL